MKVKYEQLFPTASFLNCRIGFELDISDGMNIDLALTQLKDMATAFHMKEFPFFYRDGVPLYLPQTNTTPAYNGEEMQKEIQVEKKPDNPVDNMIAAITSCTEVKVLETFRKLAKSNEAFQTAFDETMIKLTNKNN